MTNTVTLTVANPRDWADYTNGSFITVVGGSDALSDSSDASYVELVLGPTGGIGMLVDLVGNLPEGARPFKFRARFRLGSPDGVWFTGDVADDLEGGSWDPYWFSIPDQQIDPTAATSWVITEFADYSATVDQIKNWAPQLGIGLFRWTPYSSGGTLRVYELTVDVEYGFVTPENFWTPSQTRDLIYRRGPGPPEPDPPNIPQPWDVLAAEGFYTAQGTPEPVITGQFRTQTTIPDNYDMVMDASEFFNYNTSDVGHDEIQATIKVKQFQSPVSGTRPDPLPRRIRMRLYPTWWYVDGVWATGEPDILSPGGTWNVYVLASTTFNSFNGTMGSDVNSGFMFAPGSMPGWTIMATVSMTGSAVDQRSPRPAWVADYGLDPTLEVSHYGTVTGGNTFADIEFEWNDNSGNLSLAIVDDYWLYGTAPPFPLGNEENDKSNRRITAYVDLWENSRVELVPPLRHVQRTDELGLDMGSARINSGDAHRNATTMQRSWRIWDGEGNTYA